MIFIDNFLSISSANLDDIYHFIPVFPEFMVSKSACISVLNAELICDIYIYILGILVPVDAKMSPDQCTYMYISPISSDIFLGIF